MEAAREQGRRDGGARVAFWSAWSLAGLCVALFVASVPLLVLARSAHIPSSWEANLTVGNLLGGAPFLIFPRETMQPEHVSLWLRETERKP